MVKRVERHIIKPKNKYYLMLDEMCFASKNLYNFANYQIRQQFCKDGAYISYNKMDKLLKESDKCFDYRSMPSAQSAQQCLKMLDKNWKSFFVSIKDYAKHKDKYKGRPRIPGYLPKNGRNILIFTNQICKKKDGFIHFPKTLQGFTLKTKAEFIQQVRVLPRHKYLILEVIYQVEIPEIKQDEGRYLGIDIGLDNFATIVNTFGKKPIVINGKGLKSVNKYFNKQISYYRSIAKQMNQLDYTNRMNQLTLKRNNRVSDFIHKASRFTVQYALENNVSVIVIGNNKDWKRESPMSKKVNQSFVGLPHQTYINQVVYKAEQEGIPVILTEESYTSGTSFLDGESPEQCFYDKTRRKFRGLFVSNNGVKINADVNGAYQIIKKVFPNVFFNGIEGVGLHPFRVNVV